MTSAPVTSWWPSTMPQTIPPRSKPSQRWQIIAALTSRQYWRKSRTSFSAGARLSHGCWLRWSSWVSRFSTRSPPILPRWRPKCGRWANCLGWRRVPTKPPIAIWHACITCNSAMANQPVSRCSTSSGTHRSPASVAMPGRLRPSSFAAGSTSWRMPRPLTLKWTWNR